MYNIIRIFVYLSDSFLPMSTWECINQRSFYGDLVDEVV